MNLDDDVVYCCRRLGPLHQRHSSRSRGLIRHHDGFHIASLSVCSVGVVTAVFARRWRISPSTQSGGTNLTAQFTPTATRTTVLAPADRARGVPECAAYRGGT